MPSCCWIWAWAALVPQPWPIAPMLLDTDCPSPQTLAYVPMLLGTGSPCPQNLACAALILRPPACMCAHSPSPRPLPPCLQVTHSPIPQPWPAQPPSSAPMPAGYTQPVQ